MMFDHNVSFHPDIPLPITTWLTEQRALLLSRGIDFKTIDFSNISALAAKSLAGINTRDEFTRRSAGIIKNLSALAVQRTHDISLPERALKEDLVRAYKLLFCSELLRSPYLSTEHTSFITGEFFDDFSPFTDADIKCAGGYIKYDEKIGLGQTLRRISIMSKYYPQVNKRFWTAVENERANTGPHIDKMSKMQEVVTEKKDNKNRHLVFHDDPTDGTRKYVEPYWSETEDGIGELAFLVHPSLDWDHTLPLVVTADEEVQIELPNVNETICKETMNNTVCRFFGRLAGEDDEDYGPAKRSLLTTDGKAIYAWLVNMRNYRSPDFRLLGRLELPDDLAGEIDISSTEFTFNLNYPSRKDRYLFCHAEAKDGHSIKWLSTRDGQTILLPDDMQEWYPSHSLPEIEYFSKEWPDDIGVIAFHSMADHKHRLVLINGTKIIKVFEDVDSDSLIGVIDDRAFARIVYAQQKGEEYHLYDHKSGIKEKIITRPEIIQKLQEKLGEDKYSQVQDSGELVISGGFVVTFLKHKTGEFVRVAISSTEKPNIMIITNEDLAPYQDFISKYMAETRRDDWAIEIMSFDRTGENFTLAKPVSGHRFSKAISLNADQSTTNSNSLATVK